MHDDKSVGSEEKKHFLNDRASWREFNCFFLYVLCVSPADHIVIISSINFFLSHSDSGKRFAGLYRNRTEKNKKKLTDRLCFGYH